MHGSAGRAAQGHHPAPSRAFVDFQNDVTTKDLALAMREGFESVEHIKRYTTTGMATDQGKTSNMNGAGVRRRGDWAGRSRRSGSPPSACRTRRSRSASSPGYERRDLFDPVRTTPTHAWAEAQGAVFEDVGQWKRARYFPRPGEDMHAAVDRECRAVRAGVGMFDASTLGKIEVVGPDAATFLSRMYVNGFATLAVGKCRYGILLRDDGFIYDDGVIARVAPRTASTSRRPPAARPACST